jgi:hypothetical protein
VGTIRPASGNRLGQALTGLDTPTLKGIWQTAPYLHDGSAATLIDVLDSASHGNTDGLTAPERQQLAAYLLQIDEAEARVSLQDAAADGIVSLEAERPAAEHGQGGHAWTSVPPGAETSGSAVVSEPNIGAQVDAGYAGSSPRLDFPVLFVKTGTHYVWVRGRGATAADNSVHVGLDWQMSATCDRIGSFPAQWTWMSDTMDGAPATFEVSEPGIHTVNVWMREDGFELDKIVITTNPGLSISGMGPAESPIDEILPPAPSGAAGGGGGGGGCGALGAEALALLAMCSILNRWRRRS